MHNQLNQLSSIMRIGTFVTLDQIKNYSFPVEDYDNSTTLFPYGLDDNIYGVKVPTGYMIYLWADPAYQGNRKVAITDVADLNTLTTEWPNPGVSKLYKRTSKLYKRTRRRDDIQNIPYKTLGYSSDG